MGFQFVAKLLCFCFCLLDAIVELYTMDGNDFLSLSQRKGNVDFMCNKRLFNS